MVSFIKIGSISHLKPGIYKWSDRCATKLSNKRQSERFVYKTIFDIGDVPDFYDLDCDLFGWYEDQCGDRD